MDVRGTHPRTARRRSTRLARLLALAAAAVVLTGLATTDARAAVDCATTPSVTVTTWAQFQASVSGVTCASGQTYTITIANGITRDSGDGITWTQNGELVVTGSASPRPTVNINGADTWFVRSNSGNGPITLRNLVITGINSTSNQWASVLTTYSSSATYTVDNTKIHANTTLNATVVSQGPLVLTNGTEILNNVANGAARSSYGGPVYAGNGLTISASTISGNANSGGDGRNSGGVYVQSGDATITNSTIADNTAANNGGGLYVNNGTATIVGSTISGNTALGEGGGLAVLRGDLTNTTVSGNTGGGSAGGGIRAGSELTLTYSTVAGNVNATGPASITLNSGTLTTTASVITAAAANSCSISGTRAGSYSIASSLSCLPTTLGTNQQSTNAAIDLGALADNGGRTQTMLPDATGTPSVLIGFINAANPAPSVTTDQRGITRSQPFTVGAVQVSANADLSALAATAGGSPLTLSPSFTASTTAYAAGVATSITSATITATAAEANATITVDGTPVTSGTASAPIPLAIGANAIDVVVTAENLAATRTYTLTITRAPSADADLSGLTLAGGGPLDLSPAFAAATTAYTTSVTNAVPAVTVTPTAADANATITVAGTAVTSGSASAAVPLAVGANAIAVVVTAQDGTTTKTYTITVSRAAAASTSAPTVERLTPGDRQMTVSWTDPSAPPGTTYVVVASPGGRSCTAAAPATSCTITGLVNGESYTFIVAATTPDGASAASAPSRASKPAPQARGALRIVAVHAEGGALVVRVRTTRGGALRAIGTTGTGALRAATRVCTTTLTAQRAGAYTLTCAFTRAARNALAGRSMRVTVAVRLTAADGSSVTRTERITVARHRPGPSPVTG